MLSSPMSLQTGQLSMALAMPLARAPPISAALGPDSLFYLLSLRQCMIAGFSGALLRLRDGPSFPLPSFSSINFYKILDSLNLPRKSLVCAAGTEASPVSPGRGDCNVCSWRHLLVKCGIELCALKQQSSFCAQDPFTLLKRTSEQVGHIYQYL